MQICFGLGYSVFTLIVLLTRVSVLLTIPREEIVLKRKRRHHSSQLYMKGGKSFYEERENSIARISVWDTLEDIVLTEILKVLAKNHLNVSLVYRVYMKVYENDVYHKTKPLTLRKNEEIKGRLKKYSMSMWYFKSC